MAVLGGALLIAEFVTDLGVTFSFLGAFAAVEIGMMYKRVTLPSLFIANSVLFEIGARIMAWTTKSAT